MVGSSLGRLRWPGSRRTLEGSASVFLSSLATLVFASCVLVQGKGSADDRDWEGVVGEGGEGWGRATARLAWPVALVSLMEAFTSQVRNRTHEEDVV